MTAYTAFNELSLLPWTIVTAGQTMLPNMGYICNGVAQLTMALPASYSANDRFAVLDHSGFGFVVSQTNDALASQQVFDLGLSTTLGATGTTTTTINGQVIELLVIVANGAIRVISNKGAFTYA